MPTDDTKINGVQIFPIGCFVFAFDDFQLQQLFDGSDFGISFLLIGDNDGNKS